ncbi:hypothetical protein [Streptomyces lavendulocolor]|uniref:hypothetical protein n=1 Tax=Streptomyces lavendulocolor TaxID=67316 RepID=UPI003C2F77E6
MATNVSRVNPSARAGRVRSAYTVRGWTTTSPYPAAERAALASLPASALGYGDPQCPTWSRRA